MLNLRDQVRVKGSDSIEGEVKHRRFSDDGAQLEYLIAWEADNDETGETDSHERYFLESQLVKTADAPPQKEEPVKEVPVQNKGTKRVKAKTR